MEDLVHKSAPCHSTSVAVKEPDTGEVAASVVSANLIDKQTTHFKG